MTRGGMVKCTCTLNTQDAEAEGKSPALGYSGLHTEFQASQGYISVPQKKKAK